MWTLITEMISLALKWLFHKGDKTDAELSNDRTEQAFDAAQKTQSTTQKELEKNESDEKKTIHDLDALNPDSDDGFDRLLKSNDVARQAADQANRSVRKN